MKPLNAIFLIFIFTAIFLSVQLVAGQSGSEKLVAYYPLNGNANDLSGYANNGIVYGATPTIGKIGQGYQFDGNDYIDIGNPSQIQLTNNFTISAWVKLPVQDGYYGIVGKMKLISRADGMNGWMLYRGSSGGLALPQQYRFTIGDGEWPPHFTESIINHPDNEWHYVTAIAEDSEIRVYVDGVQTGSIAILDSIVDSGEYASIGRQYSTHVSGEYGYAYGIIDEVKIWNYALGDEEILSEYTKDSIKSCSNIGQVDYQRGVNGEYCDADGTWKSLKANGLSCGNDFECDIGTCVDGVCGGRYEGFSERGNLIQQIWNFLSGTECEPGEDDCREDHLLIRTCGSTGLWEDKNSFVIGRCGYTITPNLCSADSCNGNIFLECVSGVLINRGNVDGKCNYTTPIQPCTANSCDGENFLECVSGSLVSRGNVNGQCGYNSGGGGGGGGGGSCTPIWRCGNWSNLIQSCGTRTCTDRNNCNKPQTKPIESKQCPGVASFCGDGACDANENENTCLVDCPKVSECGNGVCGADESSLSCSLDCPAEKPQSKWWIFWIIVFLFLAAIAGVGYAIYRKTTKEEKGVNANIESKKNEIPQKNISQNSPMKRMGTKNIKKGKL